MTPEHAQIQSLWPFIQLLLLFLTCFYVSGHAIHEIFHREEDQPAKREVDDPKRAARFARIKWTIQALCASGYTLFYFSEFFGHAAHLPII